MAVAVIVGGPVILDVHVNGTATVDVIERFDHGHGSVHVHVHVKDHGSGHAHDHGNDHDHGF